MSSAKPVADGAASSRTRLRWTIVVVVVGVLILGSGAAYYVRSNLPVELTRADVVGTWVRANGAPCVAVFHKDGTVSIQDVPFSEGKPETGQGRSDLGSFQGPTVEVGWIVADISSIRSGTTFEPFSSPTPATLTTRVAKTYSSAADRTIEIW